MAMIRDACLEPMALALTGQGEPSHPLYLRGDLQPQPVIDVAL